MRYMIVLLLLLASCSILPHSDLSLPVVDTYYMADAWINNKIKYVNDWTTKPALDNWKKASETLHDGYGDCEDMAILFLEICRANGLGVGTFCVQYCPDYDAFHAYALVGDYKFNCDWHGIDLYYLPYSNAEFLAGYL
jgi:hypothetical protein